ncbi:MAG: ABC transporter permease [Azoarcus sp.]|jgi:ABC-2 type transport system permease protein|nr:ABC transporter permease [Azoarcus sp.]
MRRTQLFIRLAALWKKEWLTLARDRHGLAALFIMPAIFILIMSLALADSLSVQREASLAYAVLDLDGTPVSHALDARLGNLDLLNKTASPSSEADARHQVRDGEVAFVIIIPRGFALQMGANQPPELRLLIDPAVPGMVRSGFRQHAEAAVTRVWLTHALERLGQNMMLPDMERIASPEITVESVGKQEIAVAVPPSSVQQNVPAWLIFSMFFVVVPISTVFIGERQHGTLQRLRAQRVSFGLVLTGKFIPFVLVNQIQAAVMVAIGRWLVPFCGGEALSLPDNAPALAALMMLSLAVSVAAVGWALFIASIARSSEQATILGGIGNILMGAIGGIMVPRFVMPAAMQAWTSISPMGWALEGFHEIMLRQGSITDVLPTICALLCFGLAALAVAAFLNRRATST